MPRHPADIFHERNRVPKNIVVDALENVADLRAALVKDHTVGVIDMTAPVWPGAQKITKDLKLKRYGPYIVLKVHGKSLRKIVAVGQLSQK
jgi:hypothetical protein